MHHLMKAIALQPEKKKSSHGTTRQPDAKRVAWLVDSGCLLRTTFSHIDLLLAVVDSRYVDITYFARRPILFHTYYIRDAWLTTTFDVQFQNSGYEADGKSYRPNATCMHGGKEHYKTTGL